ncbi:MAG TPA: HupE/UreJ family protein [Pirellulaceae bacterium]|nr:HupE/UreJ family protein [Pirellulaceae bacterium]
MASFYLACAIAIFGHNPDTSYARVEIAKDKVETRLTYDLFTLLSIVRLDDNRDGQVSRAELTRHLPQIEEFLSARIDLVVNEDDENAKLGRLAGFVWPPDAREAIPEADYHSQNGLIHFRFVRELTEVPQSVAIWFDFFETFGERHSVLGAFVLDGVEDAVPFTKFEPEFTYETGWTPNPPPSAEPAPLETTAPASPVPPSRSQALSRSVQQFFWHGVRHILEGYDHICFLIALIVVSKLRELVKIVTSFTIAHSITLILATLNVVRINPRLVEICIAATIVYVALENLWVKETRHRWWLTFCFGLIHGFGFANVLGGLELPTSGLVRCLLSFNVGVEVGQLAIAAALFPLAALLARWKHGRKVAAAISIVLALFGTAWLVDRAFALKFMPF